jgi:glycosyltransferase involved in cell wall biosynthesis
MKKMRILIATVQVPFVRGGAEVHAEQLCNVLRAAGHEVEVVAIPFKWYPPERILDHILACRLLDLTESCGAGIDRLIGLKFPAYLAPHPNKVLWILHQHRQAYDLWDHPLGYLAHAGNGAEVRAAIVEADRQWIPEAKAVFANSVNVAMRLKQYCGIDSEPLYHPPPNAEKFYCAADEEYLFYPSRLTTLKRQALVLQAMAQTTNPVRVRFSGSPENPAFAKELINLAHKLKVDKRVEWLGYIAEAEIQRNYAHARGVIFIPVDEDYGYITLEAMLSAKPVITCTDSGGALEFVLDRETGLIAEPTPASLAAAMDDLWENPGRARTWGEAGRVRYQNLDITWTNVIERLLA